MKMMKYTYTIFHVLGKNLVIADALSRAPAQQQTADDDEWNSEVVDAYVQAIFNSLPATDKRIEQIQASQATCILLKKYCLERWPPSKS